MDDNGNILISLDSCHANNIYAGAKKVELRRRTMRVAPGTIVWIYEKMPVGSITGYATITAVHTASPAQLWRRFNSVSGLSKAQFFNYFSDLAVACALELDDAQHLHRPLPLVSLKNAAGNFQPPQFFTRLSHVHPVLLALHDCAGLQSRIRQIRTPTL